MDRPPVAAATLRGERWSGLENWKAARRRFGRCSLRSPADRWFRGTWAGWPLARPSASGKTNTAVARELRVAKQTVGKWRSRFLAKRLDGLLDEPRPGAPRTVTDADVERVVTLTLRAPRAMQPIGARGRWRGRQA